ncbi:MAG: uracil-DNA glycosylase [Porphyromonadaceae bacterium CG2_30_38_12]|nr:MAG: uracil-DNA glycosylase [Porphyromonadaceae bacterium CG2_30_38_12]
MEFNIETSWKEHLEEEFTKDYFVQLTNFVSDEYASKQIFPSASEIFNAYALCPFHQVKVVIIGQDPYHNVGQAHGLCFSVKDGVDFPPSLRNIFVEIENELTVAKPTSGNLERWAKQGVLLLNAILTVEAHRAGSHASKGWETFTSAAIRALNEKRDGIVYMLWGNYAQQKAAFVDASRNFVLKSVHPSPLSAYRGFLGCGHFSAANRYLLEQQKSPINW